ncbi:DgyrCDS7306 [Dimorphilus gyrociliatus]|uniref:DgyrCDS7306 n=1 Tax=Dimorphilus gyrociliatus TaxID=2664684 RepID=A0A7I8VRL8_9ANNE|nr:DgyrCDS7306 [Dimorphilus gyrociliatus]
MQNLQQELERIKIELNLRNEREASNIDSLKLTTSNELQKLRNDNEKLLDKLEERRLESTNNRNTIEDLNNQVKKLDNFPNPFVVEETLTFLKNQYKVATKEIEDIKEKLNCLDNTEVMLKEAICLLISKRLLFRFKQEKKKILQNEKLAHSITKKHLKFVRDELIKVENQMRKQRDMYNERLSSMANCETGKTRIEKIDQIIIVSDEKAQMLLDGSGMI